MRKTIIAALAFDMAALSLAAKVETVPDASSLTGCRTIFEYVDEAATDVRVSGSFSFYKDCDPMLFGMSAIISTRNDSAANYIYGPEAWAEGGMRHIGGNYDIAMSKEDGVWTCSVELPSACYQYTFSVSYDGGESWVRVMDPDNLPEQNAYAVGKQVSSRFYVPFDAERQSPEDDWTFLMPYEGESGTIEYFTYEGVGGTRPAQIYLPAGYDAERETPYKVLYMIHGTGGFEGDWFHQGNVPNIADRVFALGKNEPFIIVAMENNGLIDSSNNPIYELIRSDMNEGLIPMIEESYNVVEDASGRAITGLSRGGRISGTFLLNNPEDYAYIAPLSGGAANLYDGQPVKPMKETKVFLGAGFIDQASYASGEKSTSTFSKLLDQLGVDYNDGSIVLVPGAHDWFTWPQLVKLYFEDYLWK